MQLWEVVVVAGLLWCRRMTTYGWQQEASLDDHGNVLLFWTADVNKNVLMVEVQGKTRGYVALGISLHGTMENSDLLIGFVDSKGEPHVLDCWAKTNGQPIVDDSQDWKLLTGRENDTHTMIRVRRPIITNTIDDMDVYDEPTWILWAYHPHDPVDRKLEYHDKRRGARQLCLLTTNCWPPPSRTAAATIPATPIWLLLLPTVSITAFLLLLPKLLVL